jgi:hypothetical protein
VRQERLKSNEREFYAEEKIHLIDYFLADCSGGEDSTVEGIVGKSEVNYSADVERFVTVINKKGSEYETPRRIVRKLWTAGSIRKCQLRAAIVYVSLCVNRSTFESEAISWFGDLQHRPGQSVHQRGLYPAAKEP